MDDDAEFPSFQEVFLRLRSRYRSTKTARSHTPLAMRVTSMQQSGAPLAQMESSWRL
jgi:hypothetical protein